MHIKFIKKILFSIFIVVFLNCNIVVANNAKNIDIVVDLNNDGSATITQSWLGTFTEGTECYIPININRDNISDFNVSLNGRQYVFDDYWDINKNFNQKSYHCGINEQNNSLELCFGISKYGNNKYDIKYSINDFVKSYIDYDGFNFMLLNPNLSIYPSKVNCIIRLSNNTQMNIDNTAMWAYGFDGEIQFENNYIHTYSNSLISNDEHLIVVVSLKKGIINPKTTIDGYFTDVIYNANKGSKYEQDYINNYNKNDNNNDDLLLNVIFFVIISSFVITIIILLYNLIDNIIDCFKKRKFYKKCPYFRDVPNDNNIFLTYALIKDFSYKNINKTNIFGTLILKMIYDKNILEDTTKKVGFFGKVKKTTNLQFKSEPKDEFELKLYNFLLEASGENKILEKDEFPDYAKEHFNILDEFLNDFYDKGKNLIFDKKLYKKKISKKIKHLNQDGLKQLEECIGFKKYLENFSLLNEKEIKEIDIWDKYLIYATLFGVADKVYKQMKKLYPTDLIDPNDQNTYIINSYYNSVFLNNMILRNYNIYGRIYNNNLNQKAYSDYLSTYDDIRIGNGFGSDGAFGDIGGFGGSISFGGGGGFSGGGFGGGTR